MGQQVKRLCTICARGGSKGVRNKNSRMLAGMPLIAHTIRQAQSSHLFDAIAVSSDDNALLQIASTYNVKYLVTRPAALASDDAPKLPAIVHCVRTVEDLTHVKFDTLVDLDVTSPLREPADITAAVRLLEHSDADNILTGTPSRRSPYFNMVEVSESGSTRLVKEPRQPVTRRQDVPPTFDLNASIYAWKRDGFMNHPTLFKEHTRLYVMPQDRSTDIDSELDFEFVEFLINRRRKDLGYM